MYKRSSSSDFTTDKSSGSTYKSYDISKTDLEKVFEKVISTISSKNISISVYTNEFDLSMIKLFFPKVECKLGYLPNSIAFVDHFDLNIYKKHFITVLRSDEEVNLFEYTEEINNYKVFYLKDPDFLNKNDKEEKHGDESNEEEKSNKLILCDYVCTLFPPKKGVNLNDIQITTVGVYSVTSYKSNLQIVDFIKKKVGKDIIIMDSTACVGGDTIGFAMNFNYVISVEKNQTNYNALKNNVEVYKLDNVSVLNKNFVEEGMDIIKSRKPEVVYFDPPWGGKDYLNHDKLDLFLDAVNIKDIIKDILDQFNFVQMVVLKVPINFNYNELKGKLDIHKLKKFHVVLITR
jgi:predicted RNA methylase